jgi:hypothetical protein
MDMGSLSVEMSTVQNEWESIWTVAGNQGDEWRFVEVVLPEKTEFSKLRIVGTKIDGSRRGDIAIDHIKLIGVQTKELKEYFLDNDMDGFGNAENSIFICSSVVPQGYSSNNLDCDDSNAMIHPGADEIPCNLIDENCNGFADDVSNTQLKYELISTVDEKCKGDESGAIDIEITDGVRPYNYLWNNGSITEDLVGLNSGIYYCTITDVAGCQLVTDPIIIGFEQVLLYSVESVNNTSCAGAVDGALSILAGGGTEPYDIRWSNGLSGNTITDLSAGSYTATVTDAAECEIITNPIEVKGNQRLTLGVSAKRDVECFNGNNGFIQLGILGGKMPYNISWSNGKTTNSISQLKSGLYSATVTDADGCQNIIEDIEVAQPDSLRIIVNSIDHVDCFGDFNSKVDVSVIGGNQPYSYLWSDGSFSQDLKQKAAGVYGLTVTDFKSCKSILKDIEIRQPQEYIVEIDSIASVDCIGSEDGYIRVDVSGGTAPYQYNWSISDGEATDDAFIGNLLPGKYFLTVVDQLGCKSEGNQFEIFNNNRKINISLLQLDEINCFNDSTASIIAVANGGELPFEYNWSAGKKIIKDLLSDTIQNLVAGSYKLTITDGVGCTGVSDIIQIKNPEELTYELRSVKNNKCFGDKDGSIIIGVTGGFGTKNVIWNNGMMGPSIFDLEAGDYFATIEDDNGCILLTQNILVDAPDLLTIDFTSMSSDESSNGKITVDVDGGVPPYSFEWGPPISTEKDSVVSNLSPGNYFLTVEDANACLSDTTIIVDFVSGLVALNDDLNFVIYPNPNYGKIYFNHDQSVKVDNVAIFSIDGSLIAHIPQNQIYKNSFHLPQNIEEGIYIIKFNFNNNKSIHRLLFFNSF